VIARDHVADRATDSLDHARALVPIDLGPGERLARQLPRQEVGVTHPSGDDSNQNLVIAGAREVEFLHAERSMAFPKYCSSNSHWGLLRRLSVNLFDRFRAAAYEDIPFQLAASGDASNEVAERTWLAADRCRMGLDREPSQSRRVGHRTEKA